VRVTSGEEVIAEFRGHSRTVAGAWLPDTDAEQS
jgi:acyl-CoA thioesterase